MKVTWINQLELQRFYFKDTLFCSLDERIKVAAVHVHSKNYTYSDVALLKLENKLDYSLGVMPICLPEVRKVRAVQLYLDFILQGF